MKNHFRVTTFAIAVVALLGSGCADSFEDSYHKLYVRKLTTAPQYSITCSNTPKGPGSVDVASDLCRYRAATISLENDFPYFAVDDVNRRDGFPITRRLYNGKTYEEILAEDRRMNPDPGKDGEISRECRIREALKLMAYSDVTETRWVSFIMTISCHKTPPANGHVDAKATINEMRQRYRLD